MSKGMLLGSREQRGMLDLAVALGASLDLHAVWKDTFSLLLPLVGADCGALATGRAGCANDYEWIVRDLPPSFLGAYEEMAPHDFVRSSVQPKLNVVVLDSEMIDRRALERNMMYHRAREVGSPLEQVMAVMLDVGNGFQSGLALYRARRRPFAERERSILQQLTPSIANAVRNCRLFAKAERRCDVLEAFLGSDKEAVIVVRAPAQEIDRTALATALLDAWFTPVERGAGALPRVLLDELTRAQVARARGRVGPSIWTRERGAAELVVELLPLPEQAGDSLWGLRLHEVPGVPPVPARWRARLSKRECDVVAGIVRGWDNALIAQELRCAPNTVKQHARSIFSKLGVDDRKRLLASYRTMRDV